MHAFGIVRLTVCGVAGACLSLVASCSTGEPGGSSGGEVQAAVHDLKCNDSYCNCAGLNGDPPWPGMDEEKCRNNYCEGGRWYYGGDVECKYDPRDSLKCDATYCDCVEGGAPEYICQDLYCEGGKHYRGGDAVCPDKPVHPECDTEAYCDCVAEEQLLEPACRQLHCNGGNLPVGFLCPILPEPPCKNPGVGSTDALLLSAATLNPSQPSKPWKDVHDATDTDRQGASVILESDEISDYLVLRNPAGLNIPTTATEILSVTVEGRLKASPGYQPYTADAWLVGPNGSSNESHARTVYSHEPYRRHFFRPGQPAPSIWGGFGKTHAISLNDARSPQFGACFRMRGTHGRTRAAVDSAFVYVTYATCNDPPPK